MLGFGGVSAGTAWVDIHPDTRGFTQELQRNVTGATAAAERDIDKSLKSIGGKFTAAGKLMTMAFTLPIVAIGGGALAAAIQFEDSFAGVRKTVDATEGEFKKLERAFRDMAKEIPINVNELNNIGEAAGALGIKKENILAFTRTVADLGVTTDLTSLQAADALARIANIMGTAQTEFSNLGSTIVALGNAGASTESEIVSMALRIAGAGKSVGLTEAQVLGFASALASVGVEAESGGSAISRTFVDIASSISKGDEKLTGFAKVAGMSAADFKKAFQEDAAGATISFIEGLGKIQTAGGDLFGVLEELGITELRQRDALLRAAGAGSLFRDQLELANKSYGENNALQEEAAKRYETTKSQLTLLWNKVKDLAIELGQALLPMLRDLVEAAEPFIEWLGRAVKGFVDLPGPAKKLIVVIAALIAVLGPLLVIVGMVVTAIGAIGVAVLGPILAAVALIAAFALAAIWIKNHWDEIVAVVMNAVNAVKEWLANAVETVKGWVQNVIDVGKGVIQWFADLPGNIVELLGKLLVALWNFIPFAIGWAIGFGVRMLIAFMKFWIELPGNIWNALVATFNFLKDFIPMAITWARELGGRVQGAIIDFFIKLPGRIWDFLMAAGAKIGEAGPALAGAAWALGQKIQKAVSDGVAGVVKAVKDWIMNIPQMLMDLGGSLYDAAAKIAKKIFEGFKKGLFGSPRTKMEYALLDAHERMKKIMADITGDFGSLGDVRIGVGGSAVMGGPGIAGMPAAAGYATANITLEMDGRTIAKSVGQPLVDDIRMKTGMKV